MANQKTFQDIIIFTGEAQNSTEAVGEWEQKGKPMEQIGLWGTKPLKGTNGIHNGHNERCRIANCCDQLMTLKPTEACR